MWQDVNNEVNLGCDGQSLHYYFSFPIVLETFSRKIWGEIQLKKTLKYKKYQKIFRKM